MQIQQDLEVSLEALKNQVADYNKLLIEHQKLEEEKRELNQKQAEAEAKLKDKESEYERSCNQIQSLQLERDKFQQALDFKNDQYEKLRAKERSFDKINADLNASLDKIKTYQELVSSYTAQIKELENQNAKEEADFKTKKKEHEKLITEKDEDIRKIDDTRVKLENDNLKLEQEKRELEQELKREKDKNKEVEAVINTRRKKLAEERKELERQDGELKKQKEGLNKQQKELERLIAIEAQLLTHKTDIKKLIEENEVKKLHTLELMNDIRDKKQRLEEEKTSWNNNSERGISSMESSLVRSRRSQVIQQKDYDSFSICIGVLGGVLFMLILLSLTRLYYNVTIEDEL